MMCRRRADGQPKKGYVTEVEAQQHAGVLENVYLCAKCDLWHVGHLPGMTMRRQLDQRLNK